MKRKVLVIDDEENFCSMVKNYLEDTGKFEAATVSDPRKAMETAKKFKPDVILLDLRMPHIGGFEICELLDKDEDTKHIPVIVITGFTDEGDVKKAFHLGANRYITKPVELHKLVLDIEDLIE